MASPPRRSGSQASGDKPESIDWFDRLDKTDVVENLSDDTPLELRVSESLPSSMGSPALRQLDVNVFADNSSSHRNEKQRPNCRDSDAMRIPNSQEQAAQTRAPWMSPLISSHKSLMAAVHKCTPVQPVPKQYCSPQSPDSQRGSVRSTSEQLSDIQAQLEVALSRSPSRSPSTGEQLQELSRQNRNLQIQVETAKSGQAEMERLSRAEMERAASTRKELESRLKQLQEQNAMLQAKCLETPKNPGQHSAGVICAGAESSDWHDDLEAKLLEQARDLQRTQAALREQQSQRTELEARLEAMREGNTKGRAQLEARYVREMQAAAAAQEEAMERLRLQLYDEADVRVAKVERECTSLRTECEALQAKLSQSDEKLRNQISNTSDLELSSRKLELLELKLVESTETSQKEKLVLESRLSEAQGELVCLRKDVQQAKAEAASASLLTERVQAELNDNIQKLKQTEIELRRAKDSTCVALYEASLKNAQYDTLNKQFDALKDDLSHLKQGHQQEQSEREHELTELRLAHSDLETKLSTTQSECDQLRSQLETNVSILSQERDIRKLLETQSRKLQDQLEHSNTQLMEAIQGMQLVNGVQAALEVISASPNSCTTESPSQPKATIMDSPIEHPSDLCNVAIIPKEKHLADKADVLRKKCADQEAKKLQNKLDKLQIRISSLATPNVRSIDPSPTPLKPSETISARLEELVSTNKQIESDAVNLLEQLPQRDFVCELEM